MNFEDLIIELDNAIDKLFNEYSLFIEKPQDFELFASDKLAWKFYYEGTELVDKMASLLYLKSKCRETLNNIFTLKFLYFDQIKNLAKHSDIYDACDTILNSSYDELISLELELDRRLQLSAPGKQNEDSEQIISSQIDEKSEKSRSETSLRRLGYAPLFEALIKSEILPFKSSQRAFAELLCRSKIFSSVPKTEQLFSEFRELSEDKKKEYVNETITLLKDAIKNLEIIYLDQKIK